MPDLGVNFESRVEAEVALLAPAPLALALALRPGPEAESLALGGRGRVLCFPPALALGFPAALIFCNMDGVDEVEEEDLEAASSPAGAPAERVMDTLAGSFMEEDEEDSVLLGREGPSRSPGLAEEDEDEDEDEEDEDVGGLANTLAALGASLSTSSTCLVLQ